MKVPVWVSEPLIPSVLLNRGGNAVTSTTLGATKPVEPVLKTKAAKVLKSAKKADARVAPLETTAAIINAASSSPVGGTPSYLLVGGLVFVTLTKEYIKSNFDPRHMTDMENWAEEFRIMSSLNKPKQGELDVMLYALILN